MKLTTGRIKEFVLNKKTLAGLLVVVLVGGYFVYRSSQNTPTSGTQTTAQAKVTRGNIEVTVTGTGTITPVGSEDINPGVSGTVEKVHVREGDHVKKGDLLMELSSDDLELQIQKAKLDLEKAQVSLSSSASEPVADTIVAPIAGRIVDMDIKIGTNVSPNGALATIQDDSQLAFDMLVDSTTASKAVVNQKVQVFMPDRGETVEGQVVSKGNQALEGRSYLKIAVPTSGDLSTGMKAFGTITINGQADDALSVGTLEWKDESQVKATLSGKVNGVYVQDGQVVKKGQKLFSLSSSDNLNQQKSQQLSYQQSQLTLADLEGQKADLLVRASIDGVVSGFDVQVGDEVSSGGSVKSNSSSTDSSSGSTNTSATSTLGKIINSGQMEVAFPVDEVDIAKVKVGQSTKVTVDALPEGKYEGKVVKIAEEGTVTNNVSSFDVTILLDNSQKVLKSGMTANVTIQVANKENVLLIPIEALQERGESKGVLVAGNSAAQPQQMVEISVGLTNETFAEVTKGVQEGQTLLLPGVTSKTNGGGFPGMGGGMGGPGGNRRTSSGGGSAVIRGSGNK